MKGACCTPLAAAGAAWATPAAAAPASASASSPTTSRRTGTSTRPALCGEAGFEAVEFRTTHAHGVERTLAPAGAREVRRKCEAAGLRQTSLGSVCEFHSPDAAVVERNVADCREWVELARDIGARAVKVRPNGLPPGVDEEKTLDQIGRALARCGSTRSSTASRSGSRSTAKARLPPRMRRIMDACGHPSVGVTWNSNDTDVVAGSVAAVVRAAAALRALAHITDLASGYPYRELFSLFDRAGFAGFTLCEYPKSVPVAEGAVWLKDYRARWQALRDAPDSTRVPPGN